MPRKKSPQPASVEEQLMDDIWNTPIPIPPTKADPKPPRKRPRLHRKPRTAKATKKALDAHRLVEVVLTRQHSINAVNYGPGRTKVPQMLANVLMEQEHRAKVEEENFRSTDRAFMARLGRNGVPVAHPVSADTFDTSQLSAVPFGTISGKQFPQQ